MVQVMESSHKHTYDLPPVPGWSTRMLKAAAPNLSWLQIVCELIDNSRAFRVPGRAVHVRITWTSGGARRTFQVIDDGVGATDAAPFMELGNSGGIDREDGNSTHGTGLCVVEARLNGELEIAAFADGSDGMIIRRVIGLGTAFETWSVANEESTKAEHGIFTETGTAVRFDRVTGRNMPQISTVKSMAVELGEVYAEAIRSGDVKITLTRNNETVVVHAAQPRSLEEAYTKTFTIDGHTYTAEWGVTSDVCRTDGVELCYGGKVFDSTSIPCGDYNTARFWGRITIPRSCGRDKMDLLKRDIDNEQMSPVYDYCSELFQEALRVSDERSVRAEDAELTQQLEQLLSVAKKLAEAGEGSRDLREFKGRDMSNQGVQPKNTGRTRRGRRGTRGKQKNADDINIQWQPLGVTANMCKFDVNADRLTFNTENSQVVTYRDNKDVKLLGVIGAAVIADALRTRTDSGYGDFGYQFTKFVARMG